MRTNLADASVLQNIDKILETCQFMKLFKFLETQEDIDISCACVDYILNEKIGDLTESQRNLCLWRLQRIAYVRPELHKRILACMCYDSKEALPCIKGPGVRHDDKYLEKENYCVINDYEFRYRQHDYAMVSDNHEYLGEKILHIGCNTGANSIILARNGKRVLGIDVNAGALVKAKELLAQEDDGIVARVSFMNMNVIDLPFEEEFDSVVAFDVFEHLYPEDVPQILKVLKRCLKVGGHLLFHFPHMHSFADKTHVGIYNLDKARSVFQNDFLIKKLFVSRENDPDDSRRINLLGMKADRTEKVISCQKKIMHPDPEKFESDFWNAFYSKEKSRRIVRKMQTAVAAGTPFDFIRIGDAELELLRFKKSTNEFGDQIEACFYEKNLGINPLAMTHDKFISIRDEFISCCMDADILATHRHTINQDASRHADIFLKELVPSSDYLDSEVDVSFNAEILDQGFLLPLLKGARLLLIGNSAPELAVKMRDKEFLRQYADIGMFPVPPEISGAVFVPHDGHKAADMIEELWDEVQEYEFDIAIISASLTGKIIAGRIKNHLGKIALDIGWNMQFLSGKSSPVAPADDWRYMTARRGYKHLFPGRLKDSLQKMNGQLLKNSLYGNSTGSEWRLDLPIVFYMDPLIYCAQADTSFQSELLRIEGASHNLYILGMLHKIFNGLTDVFLGGLDCGIDCWKQSPDGCFSSSRIPAKQISLYLESLDLPDIEELYVLKTMTCKIESLSDISQEEGASYISTFHKFLSKSSDYEIDRLAYPAEKTSLNSPRTWDKAKYLKRNPNATDAADLFDTVSERLGKYYKRFYLFCSYGTDDYVKDSSDIDIYGILRDDVIYTPELLIELRKEHLALYKMFFCVASLQHHGILSFSEADLNFFHESLCPLEVIEMGYCRNLEPEESVKCRKLSLPSVFKSSFYGHVKNAISMHSCLPFQFNLLNLHWRTNLLPLSLSVYNQMQGGSSYKRESLFEITPCLEKYNCDLLKRLTDFRNMLGSSKSVAYLKKRLKEDCNSSDISDYLNIRNTVNPGIDILRIIKDDYFIEQSELMSSLFMEIYEEEEDGMFPCLHNFPEHISPDVYEEVRQSISEAAEKEKGGVYFFGETGTPGISDIDFVYAPDSGNASAQAESYKRLENILAEESYINIHPPFIISADLLDDLKFLYPVNSITTPENHSVFRYEEGDNALDLQRLFSLTEICMAYFLQDTVLPLLKRNIDVRMSLLRLNGLRHAMHIAAQFMEKKPDSWASFEEEIVFLRKDWFKLGRAKQSRKICALLIEGLYIQLGIIELCCIETSKRFKMKLNVQADSFQPMAMLSNICFVSNWDKDIALNMTLDSYLKKDEERIFLPFEFYALLHCYSKYSPCFKKKLDHNVLLGAKYIDSVEILDPSIVARAELIEKYMKFAEEFGNSDACLPQMAILYSAQDIYSEDENILYDLFWRDFCPFISGIYWCNPYKIVEPGATYVYESYAHIILDAILDKLPTMPYFNWIKAQYLWTIKGDTAAASQYYKHIVDSQSSDPVYLYDAMVYFNCMNEIEFVVKIIEKIKALPCKHAYISDFIKSLEKELEYYNTGIKRLKAVKSQCPVIYGGGKHTVKLLSRSFIRKDFENLLIADDNRRGSIDGIKITSLQDALADGADAILVSSDAFEEHLFRNAFAIAGKHTPLVTIYNEYQR